MVRINKKALVLLAIIAVLAVFAGGIFPYSLFSICLVLILLSYFSGKLIRENLVNLTWETSYKAVSGEVIDLKTDLYNAGLVPIPYLKVSAGLPQKLVGKDQSPKIFSIMPERVVKVSREFVCRHKGIYKVSVIETEFEDVLGIFKWKKVFDGNRYLCVHPRVHTLKHLDIPLKQQFGTTAVRQNAYEDYASTKDLRKYVLGDSFKKIHWKVSAHRGDFFVRNVEINASASLNIFLDLYDYGFKGEIAYDIEEKGAECAASIMKYALSRSMSVSFTAKGEEKLSFSAKKAGQFNNFLDMLSKSSAVGDMPLEDLLTKEVRKLTWDATVVVITPCLEKAIPALISLKSSGAEFVVIYLRRDGNKRDDNIRLLRQKGFSLFVIGLDDDIRRVLGGQYEKQEH
ncbi:MAG TPA: DUF58 domain-containing protein [Negativicutes bacterium]|nr:DUF58 domain-containing protein [Negativicutes bacterium]